MRGLAALLLAGFAALAWWLWGMGGAADVTRYTAAAQRDVQNAMAAALRAIRTGDAGALATLWTLCFSYGFVHAVGPGHGKLVIGGYGVARRVPALRLAGLAVASSLAQAASAVILVYAGGAALGWTRQQMTGVADSIMGPVSAAMIAAVGLWLLVRGARAVLRLRQTHSHDGDGPCPTCGHAHGPTPDQAAQVRSWRDAIIVVGAIAIRPCTGALFLLILTWQLGIDSAGIIGVFVMGLGTASVTGMVAFAATSLRESAVLQMAGSAGVARMLALVQMAAGVTVFIVASQLVIRTL